MKAFKDNLGRRWDVAINVATAGHVKTLTGVNLYKLIDDGCRPLGLLLEDPCKLVDVLYVLVKDQADREKVTDEDFGRAFSGDSLEAAAEAFLGELTDFFPGAKVRKALTTILAKSRALRDEMQKDMETELEKLDVQKVAASLRAQTLNGSSGSVPVSSASTLAT